MALSAVAILFGKGRIEPLFFYEGGESNFDLY